MSDRSKQKSIWFIIGLTLIIVSIISILLYFLQGKTTVEGNYPEKEVSETIECNISNTNYPFFSQDDATSKTTKIVTTFISQTLSSITLIHTLNYSTHQEAVASEAINHASLGKNFNENGLDVNAFSANYSIIDNSMQMKIYATKTELNGTSSKYFLLDTTSRKLPDLLENYEKQDFNCKKTN